jgi:hypothetical protein
MKLKEIKFIIKIKNFEIKENADGYEIDIPENLRKYYLNKNIEVCYN